MTKAKICKGCSKKINEKKEKYTHVEDWNKGKKEGESWWHLNCFIEAMGKEDNSIQSVVNNLLEQATPMLNLISKNKLKRGFFQ